MSFAFLWTDMMVWMLVLALMVWSWILFRSQETKKQWQLVFRSSLATASAVVLLFYLSIALLDSVHFRLHTNTDTSTSKEVWYKGDIVSIVDVLFAHNIQSTERTYSAPFATHEYTKSVVVNKEGKTTQRYLPLKHISSNVSILKRSFIAMILGLCISIFFISIHYYWRKKRTHKQNNPKTISWTVAYSTFTFLVLILTWMYLLSFDYHVLGTDKVGGDVLYQSIKSIRTGVLIGILTTLILLPVAIVLGVSAGLFGGWIDDIIQYIYTTLSSIPGVLLIAAGVLVMQVMIDNNPSWFESTQERSDLRLLFLIVILGMTSWTGLCRLLRAETLKLSQMEYVTAAKAFGVSKVNIIRRHIVPNLMHIILISVVLDFSGLVLAEAVLSYVGVGVDPTMFSWGNMINQARLEMAREPMVWWSFLSAFLFMFVLVLAANLLSDRIQTVLDPRNKT